ncbi:MAG TPA: general stress protein [Arthrobacter sp.]|nr:general stress protein [Arthrobacter sp.]
MSNMLGQTASRDQTRTLPQGETVGTYTAYLDAQKAVDYLADQQFAVQNVSIMGNDLKTVERVTGRLSYPRVALAGAATGAWFGLFVGVVLMLFGGTEGYSTLLSSMALGAGFWMLFGVITYAMQRGKRDFTSTSQVVASNYQVIVAPEAAGEARRLLQQLPMNGRGGPTGPTGSGYGQGYGPNQYGPNQHGPNQYRPNQYGPNQHGPGQGYGQSGPAGKVPERPAGWEDPYQEPKSGTPDQPQNPQDPSPQRPPYGQPPTGPQSQPGPQAQGPQPAPGSAPGQTSPAEQAQPQQSESPRRGQFPDLPDGRPQYGERIPAANQPAASDSGQPGQQVPSRPERPPQDFDQSGHPPQDVDQSGQSKPGNGRPEENERDTGDRQARGSHPADEDRDGK